MLRPLAVIIAGILLAQPSLPKEDAERFARVLRDEARERGFDPLTGVAIIQLESGWMAETISENGEDYGLAQIRARYVGACKRDPDPLRAPGPECRAVKESLLDAEANIRQMGRLITLNRKLCREKTGSATLPRWLASYQGRNDPKRGRWCRPGEGTWKVIRYREALLEKLAGR